MSVTYWLILGAVVLLGAGLRFHGLDSESYWYDELIMVRVAQEEPAEILKDGRPPVFVILAHFWIDHFGTSETATRSLSAVAGVASIPLMFVVGTLLFSREVGLISSFLMAVSQFQIYYSQDFRYYSLFVFMTLLSFYVLIGALRSNRPSRWVAYSLATILLFHTHTFGLFIIAAQSILFLLNWRRFRPSRVWWILSQAAILIGISRGLVISWLMAVEGQGGPTQWLPEPSIGSPVSTLLRFLGLIGVASDTSIGLQVPSSGTILIAVALATVVMVIFVSRVGWKQWLERVRGFVGSLRCSQDKGTELLLLAVWAAVPILIPLVLSRVLGPMYHHRYMIAASPAVYLLIAYIIWRARKVVPVLAALGLLVILITPGLFAFYEGPHREQWREAADYVASGSASGDVIVLAESGRDQNRKNFDWYYQGGLPECGIDRNQSSDEIERMARECLQGRQRFWLVLRSAPRPDPAFRAFFLHNEDDGFRLISKREFAALTIYLFEIG